MHDIFILMDFISSHFQHVGQLPRRFPSMSSVDSVGYIPHKKNWIRHRFTTYNFSFILSGGGDYWREGMRWAVRAPCVITQSPGLLMEYGACGEWTEWEELYLIYDQRRIPALEQMGLIRRDVPVWNIRDTGPTRIRLQELVHLEAAGPMGGFADRLDRLCELMVLESILGESQAPIDPETQAIHAIRDRVKRDFRTALDFDALARQHGLSASTFRRRWAENVGVPPARYAMRLKMEEACRLLVETRLKVSEISAATGFSDPLYFSRCFSRETGTTAMEYRRDHQTPLSFRG